MTSLGFGCASVMGKVSKGDALSAMSLAFDQGITHFDIARSYGFGRAEAVLGQFLKGRRDKATITTKFGVVPPQLSLKHKLLMPVARQAMQVLPSLASRAKKQSAELLADRCFDVAYAQACLHESLSQLQTDHVDVYLLHEPVSLAADQQDALQRFMQEAKRAGKVRQWGIACYQPSDLAWTMSMQPDVVQVEGNVRTAHQLLGVADQASVYVTRPFCGGITHEVLSDLQAQCPGILPRVEALGFSVADFLLAVSARLAAGGGAVVAAMYDDNHIRINSGALAKTNQSSELQQLLDVYFNALRSTQNLAINQ
jgi:D-threo-aldose 1-dehydrogenase